MAYMLKNVLPNTLISKLYLQNDIADVCFKFEHDQKITRVPAHKTILASGSPVFRETFFTLLPEQKVVEIVDASASEFKEFLQLFYLSSMTLTIENMNAVIRLAERYVVSDRLNQCFVNVDDQITNTNVFWAYQWAVALKDEHLQQLCTKKCNDTFLMKKLFKSNEFLHCDQSILEHILQAELTTRSEIDVFKACMAWSKLSCRKNELDENVVANVKDQLGNCFYLIRFGTMPQSRINKILKDKSDLFTRDELVELLRKCTRSSNKFNGQPRKIVSYKLNRNSELVLKRRNKAGPASKVQFPQSILFSSNVRVLLGKFECAPIVAAIPADTTIIITTIYFEIIEHPSNDRHAAHTILCKGKLKYRNGESDSVKLNTAVIIKPNKMYEIRCRSAVNRTYRIRNSWREDTVVKLGKGVKITFHKHATNGIVSTMHFKPI